MANLVDDSLVMAAMPAEKVVIPSSGRHEDDNGSSNEEDGADKNDRILE